MDKNFHKRHYRWSLLLVFTGIILIMQVCSANTLMLDLSVSPQNVFIGGSVTIYAHVYDADLPGVRIANESVGISVNSNSGASANLAGPTNSSGWAAISYTPPLTGRYTFNGVTTVYYNEIPGLPPIGSQSAIEHDPPVLNVSSKALTPFHTPPPGGFVLITTTPTTAPPVTTQTMQQTTAVTQVTQAILVTQVTQATPTVPASLTDTTPPVTTLTLAGTDDGSGGYSSDVTCTLTATDNAGGSGVSVTQYSFDGTHWNTYSQPFPLVRIGPMVLYYRSSDNAGNTEVANVKAFAINGPGTPAPGTPAGSVPGAAPAGTTTADAIPFFPLPLWLVALILFVIVAAVGGALYLESQQKKEKK